jgi:hypothetical protein
MTFRYENLTKQKRPERPYVLPQSASVLLPPSPDGESGSTTGVALDAVSQTAPTRAAHTEESG